MVFLKSLALGVQSNVTVVGSLSIISQFVNWVPNMIDALTCHQAANTQPFWWVLVLPLATDSFYFIFLFS